MTYIVMNLIRTVFYALFISFLSLLGAFPPFQTAFATSQTIDNIQVDVIADNAVEARSKAFEEAQVKGFKRLVGEVLGDQASTYEMPDLNMITNYVQNFEVTNEKLSATRYIGNFSIQYDSSLLHQINDQQPSYIDYKNDTLGGVSTVAAPAQAQKILILPLYNLKAQLYLWDNNPFLEAWIDARMRNRIFIQGSYQPVIPIGSMNDIQQIPAQQALSLPPFSRDRVLERYSAVKMLGVIATPNVNGAGVKRLNIKIVHPYNPLDNNYRNKPMPETLHEFTVVGARYENTSVFYARAVQQTLKELENIEDLISSDVVTDKSSNSLPAPLQIQNTPSLQSPETKIKTIDRFVAQVNFSSMRDWIDLKQKIERTPSISSVAIKTLSSRFALLDIVYQGERNRLQANLHQAGVVFVDPIGFLQPANNASQGAGKIYQMRSINTPSS